MSSNQDKIIEKYKSGFEDRRAELSRAGKMEFHSPKNCFAGI